MNNRKIQILIIIVLTVIAYSNIFGNKFVWDDQFFIQDWQEIRDPNNWALMLTGAEPAQFSGAFRPGMSLSFWLFYQLFGQNLLGWHLQSLLIHLLCIVLIYFIISEIVNVIPSETRNLSRMRVSNKLRDFSVVSLPQNDKRWIPFIVALLFGLHPIHTESVTYIDASVNNIGLAFFLGSFYLFLKGKLGWSGILGGLAFFTYEMTLSLPILMGLYLYLYRFRVKPGMTEWSRMVGVIRVVGGYFAIAGVYLLIRVMTIHTVGRGGYPLDSFYLTMLTMSKVFIQYLWLLILPMNQTVNHTLPGGIISGYYIDLKSAAISAQSFWDPLVLGGLGILAGLGWLGWVMRKRQSLISFGIGWFLITLLPASNLIPVQEFMAERYLYLPSVGFLLVAAYLIFNLKFKIFNQFLRFKFLNTKNYLEIRNYKLEILLIVLIALSFGYLTYQRNQVWHDAISLWSDTVNKSPLSEIAYYNLGNAYRASGQQDLAIDSYKHAILDKPASMGSYINLGSIYFSESKLDLAENAFRGALQIDPNSATNYNNLGSVLTEEGKDQEALENFIKALRIDPNYLVARQNRQLLLNKNPKLSVQN